MLGIKSRQKGCGVHLKDQKIDGPTRVKKENMSGVYLNFVF